MASKIIDGIEYISIADLFLAPPETEFEHIWIDSQDKVIHDQKKMTTRDALYENKQARTVGEIYLQWEPAIF